MRDDAGDEGLSSIVRWIPAVRAVFRGQTHGSSQALGDRTPSAKSFVKMSEIRQLP